MDGWEQQEQQKDMDILQRIATDALVAAKSRPLTVDEIMAVAWSAGLANDVYKEIKL